MKRLLLLVLLFALPAWAAPIVPITCFQDTEQSTTSTTPVDASCETAALANTVLYLVIARANFGGNDLSQLGRVDLLHGSTVIANAQGEGLGGDTHFQTNQLQYSGRITGDGTSTLKFQHNNITSADTNYIGAMAIIALPLTDLTEDTDFFHDGTNSATEEVSGQANTWTDQRSVVFNLPSPTQDWIVLFSTEARTDGSDTSDAASVRFQIGGVTVSSEYHQEWEDDQDWMGFAIADIDNLAAGNHTFRIQIQNRDASTVADARRSNIWAFRKDAFDQVLQTVDTTGVSATSNTTYSDANSLLTRLYTPNQTEDVVILAYTVVGRSVANMGLIELRNVTDAVSFNVDAAEYENDAGFTADRDQIVTLLATTENITASQRDYRVRHRQNGATGDHNVGRNPADSAGIRSSLIVWSMVLSGAPPPDDDLQVIY